MTGTQAELAERVRQALREVLDPEIGMNVIDLGLVYGIETGDGHVRVRMTLTSAACPMGEILVEDVTQSLHAAFPEGPMPELELVWDPPWSPERMSEAARRELGWDD